VILYKPIVISYINIKVFKKHLKNLTDWDILNINIQRSVEGYMIVKKTCELEAFFMKIDLRILLI
jgi:hypothetical protein